MSLVRRTQPVAVHRHVHVFWIDAAWALATALLSLIVAWHALGFSWSTLQTPVTPSAEASATTFLFASTHENGWYQPITRAGAPFGARLTDTPNADGLSLLLNHVFGRITDDPFALLNLFLLAGFVLCPLIAYAVYRRLGLARLWAAVAALAFTLLPAHFLPGHQPLSTLYIAAALAAWLALDVVWHKRTADEKTAWRGFVVLAAVACGLSGTYFAFFSCLIIGTAGVGAALDAQSSRPLRRAGILVALVLLATAVQLVPSWWNTWREGGNASLVAPSIADVESNALKVAPMLLPRTGHTLDALAAVRARHDGEPSGTTVKYDVALGVIGAIGLLLLLALPLPGRWIERARVDLRRPAILVYAGLAFAIVGGFGSLFALFVTPQLHRLDQIAPFIAFLAILAAIGVLQRVFASRGPVARAAIAAFVAAWCIVDQAGIGSPDAAARRSHDVAAFSQERAFYAAVEAASPVRSMLWQLPSPPRLQEPADASANATDPFAGYLHTTRLRWSGGTTPGRPGARWQQMLDAFPLDARLPALAALGFSAIVLDRRGFADPAAIDAALAAAHLQASLHSEDGTRSLYPLPHAKAERYRALAVAPLAGWSVIESDGKDVWLWSTGDASVRLANTGAIARPCYVEFELATLAPRKVMLREGGRTLAEQDLVPGLPVRLSAYLDERAGERTLELVTDTPAVSPGAQDGRLLAFMWKMRTPPLCR